MANGLYTIHTTDEGRYQLYRLEDAQTPFPKLIMESESKEELVEHCAYTEKDLLDDENV